MAPVSIRGRVQLAWLMVGGEGDAVWLHIAHKKKKNPSSDGWTWAELNWRKNTHKIECHKTRCCVHTHSVRKLNENANEEQQHGFMVWPFCERDYIAAANLTKDFVF